MPYVVVPTWTSTGPFQVWASASTTTTRWCITDTTAFQLTATVSSNSPWLVSPRPPPAPETQEERAAREVQERHHRQQVARTRARDLLLRNLTPDQRTHFEANDCFFVTSSKGRPFRIDLGREHNVYLLDDNGRPCMNYCGHVSTGVPNEDNILVQKLLIEADEDAFLATSNGRRV